MTENAADGDSQEVMSAPVTAISAGVQLRQARLAAGIELDGLAATLKVPRHKLEALEQDRVDAQSDLVFMRALAASACRLLGIDAKAVLATLPQQQRAQKAEPTTEGLGTPFNPHSDSLGWRRQMTRPTLWAGAVLVLGAVLLTLLPAGQWSAIGNTSGAENSKPNAVAAEDSKAGTPVAAPAPPASVPTSLVTATGPASVAGQAPALLPSSSIATTAAAAPWSRTVMASAGATPNLPAVSVPATGKTELLQFQARQASWVEVIDARGEPALRRLLQAGESAGVGGLLPLRVRVGNASGTEVSVRGQPFELTAHTRDNVARFEVKP